jgi:hypothetical protein
VPAGVHAFAATQAVYADTVTSVRSMKNGLTVSVC